MGYVATNRILDVDVDAIRIANSLGAGADIVALTNSSGANGTQATVANRATIALNEANGKAAAVFGASDVAANYQFDNLWNAATAGTIYLLMRRDSDPPTEYQTGLMNASSNGAGSNENFPYTDGNVYTQFGSADARRVIARNTDFPAGAFATAYRLVTITSKAGEWKFYFDGVLIYSTTTNTVNFNANFIFGLSFVTGYFYKGKLLRMLGYTAGHTAAEVTQNYNAFNAEYFAALPAAAQNSKFFLVM